MRYNNHYLLSQYSSLLESTINNSFAFYPFNLFLLVIGGNVHVSSNRVNMPLVGPLVYIGVALTGDCSFIIWSSWFSQYSRVRLLFKWSNDVCSTLPPCSSRLLSFSCLITSSIIIDKLLALTSVLFWIECWFWGETSHSRAVSGSFYYYCNSLPCSD